MKREIGISRRLTADEMKNPIPGIRRQDIDVGTRTDFQNYLRSTHPPKVTVTKKLTREEELAQDEATYKAQIEEERRAKLTPAERKLEDVQRELELLKNPPPPDPAEVKRAAIVDRLSPIKYDISYPESIYISVKTLEHAKSIGDTERFDAEYERLEQAMRQHLGVTEAATAETMRAEKERREKYAAMFTDSQAKTEPVTRVVFDGGKYEIEKLRAAGNEDGARFLEQRLGVTE